MVLAPIKMEYGIRLPPSGNGRQLANLPDDNNIIQYDCGARSDFFADEETF